MNRDGIIGPQGSTRQKERDENHPRNEKNEGGCRLKINRFSPQQLARLEAAFSQCMHPEAAVRASLGKELGVTALQIKYWYQNRRHQLKKEKEKLRRWKVVYEYEMLKQENLELKKTPINSMCSTCALHFLEPMCPGVEHLELENYFLKEEIRKIKRHLGSLAVSAENPRTGGSSSLNTDNTNLFNHGGFDG